MRAIGVYEAKTRLPKLLDDVEQGESVTITRHGRPVAMLVPLPASRESRAREAAAKIRLLRAGNRLDGVTSRELVDEGRRL
jgi:prevent-host-death family protein